MLDEAAEHVAVQGADLPGGVDSDPGHESSDPVG